MGNNPSKHPGDAPASPVVNHAPTRSSTRNPRSSSRRHKSSHNTQSERKHATPQQAPSSPQASPHTQQASTDASMGNEHSKTAGSHDGGGSSRTKATPLKVPHRGSDAGRQRGPDTQFEPSGPPRDPEFVPHSNFGLPPRLPLPIGEELHTPGSPILDAQGSSALHEDDVGGLLPRQTSDVSNITLEEDELGNDPGQDPSYDKGRGTAPTTFLWRHGGDQVYVTGTFTNWSRKYRLNRDPNTGYLSTQLQLPPGTHHVKFIVNGEMQLSTDLPTAVDYTNILVNYIEVSADDIPKEVEHKAPEGIYPPQVIPEGIEAQDYEPAAVPPRIREGDLHITPVHWGRELPVYLKDYDKPEHSNRFMRANRAINEFPPPPGLPLFLAKSILNSTTPMKDDSSVLNMPNHTVLNHLATSSIRNDVLATSITTRYMRKYVTTLVYKPTEEVA